MQLRNSTEDLVWSKLDELIKNYPDICTCEKCRHDMAALALNQLPAHYSVSERGLLFTRTNLLEPQFLADVVTAIVYAIMIVSNNPRHDSSEKVVAAQNLSKGMSHA